LAEIKAAGDEALCLGLQVKGHESGFDDSWDASVAITMLPSTFCFLHPRGSLCQFTKFRFVGSFTNAKSGLIIFRPFMTFCLEVRRFEPSLLHCPLIFICSLKWQSFVFSAVFEVKTGHRSLGIISGTT
jgi:hypothetical protein